MNNKNRADDLTPSQAITVERVPFGYRAKLLDVWVAGAHWLTMESKKCNSPGQALDCLFETIKDMHKNMAWHAAQRLKAEKAGKYR